MIKMIVYKIAAIPDITLSKYQAYAESGVEGMIKTQLQFIRMVHRIIALDRIHVYYIFDYDPDCTFIKYFEVLLLSGSL